MLLDVLEVLEGTGDLHAVDCLCGLSGVLEGDTEVRASRASALLVGDRSRSVSDHPDGIVLWRKRMGVERVFVL